MCVPGEEVAECDLAVGVAGPVEWGAASLVLSVQVQSHLFEIVECVGGVTLGSDMDHAEAESI